MEWNNIDMGDRLVRKSRNLEFLHEHPLFVFAADPIVAGGVRSYGQSDERWRTRHEFLQLCREITREGCVDGVLMAPSDAERLAIQERLFEASEVTPIVRMNAETAIWNPRFGNYSTAYSRTFQTVRLPIPWSGTADETNSSAIVVGLYSITLHNDVIADEAVLSAYLAFANEVANLAEFSHILEVFPPNPKLSSLRPEQTGLFLADSIVRLMSYLSSSARPLFIKTKFTTREAWKELTSFDDSLVIGALGGPRKDTHSTFRLAWDVISNGGRAILFGRTIFDEESPPVMCRYLREVIDARLDPQEAYRRYIEELKTRSEPTAL